MKAPTIKIPLGPRPAMAGDDRPHLGRHVEVGNMTSDQAIGLYRLLHGLRAENATLANGKPVFQRVDVVRWIFERAAEG